MLKELKIAVLIKAEVFEVETRDYRKSTKQIQKYNSDGKYLQIL